MKMPDKNPDVWAAIWGWIQLNISWYSVHGVAAAILMAFLRAAFMRNKRAFRYILLDATMCASIAYTAIPVCTHIFGHPDYSQFIGVMIGFVGTEKIREFLFKFINKKVSQDDVDYRD